MRKNFLFLLIIPFVGKTQIYNYPYNYNYSYPTPVYYQNYNPFATLVSGAALALAISAKNQVNELKKDSNQEEEANSYLKINTDNLINRTNDYDYIVIKNVSGWKSNENKEGIINTLRDRKKYLIYDISPEYNTDGQVIVNDKSLPDDLKNNSKVLYLYWKQEIEVESTNWKKEADGKSNKLSKLTIKNFEDKTIFESSSKNLSYKEILKPLISNYILTKQMALTKIQEYKKYLDLGIITKEEYDLKLAKYKPIILDDNN
jgi:hypothetical protein